MATNKNFEVKNGLTIAGTERISSAGAFTGSLASATTAATQSAADSSTKIATTAYTDAAITAVIGGAPGTLDTLNELAAAINDDASYASTLTTALATKLPLAGGTMTGGLISSGSNTGTNPAANGHIANELQFYNGSATDNNLNGIGFYNSNNAVDARIAGVHKSHSSRHGEIAFLLHNGSALTERVRFDKDGNVGIGGAAADPQGFGRSLHVEGAANAAVYLRDTGNSNYGYVGFVGGSTNKMSVNSYQGYLQFTTAAGVAAMTIDTSQRVGIGTTSPSTPLHTATGSSGSGLVDVARFQNTGTSVNDGARIQLTAGTSTIGAGIGCLGVALNSAHLVFHSGGNTERMRIDSAGNMLLGTTSHSTGAFGAATGINIKKPRPQVLFQDTTNNTDGYLGLTTAGLFLATQDALQIQLHTNDVEGMRMTSNRAFKVKQGTSTYANATSNYNEICSNADATANLLVRQGSTYYADCINLWYYGGTPNNTHSNFLNAFDSTATRAKIFSNGGFANYQSNNSNLCDEREKKNIVESESTWNDVKSWNIKTFHYNEDDDSDAKRYGVIAQDIEITNPELITDWEKKQEKEQELWREEDRPLPEGVSIGDEKSPAQEQVMRKAVKEQQMYIMAIKALQEAMTEIDSLKARITTLEG